MSHRIKEVSQLQEYAGLSDDEVQSLSKACKFQGDGSILI